MSDTLAIRAQLVKAMRAEFDKQENRDILGQKLSKETIEMLQALKVTFNKTVVSSSLRGNAASAEREHYESIRANQKTDKWQGRTLDIWEEMLKLFRKMEKSQENMSAAIHGGSSWHVPGFGRKPPGIPNLPNEKNNRRNKGGTSEPNANTPNEEEKESKRNKANTPAPNTPNEKEKESAKKMGPQISPSAPTEAEKARVKENVKPSTTPKSTIPENVPKSSPASKIIPGLNLALGLGMGGGSLKTIEPGKGITEDNLWGGLGTTAGGTIAGAEAGSIIGPVGTAGGAVAGLVAGLGVSIYKMFESQIDSGLSKTESWVEKKLGRDYSKPTVPLPALPDLNPNFGPMFQREAYVTGGAHESNKPISIDELYVRNLKLGGSGNSNFGSSSAAPISFMNAPSSTNVRQADFTDDTSSAVEGAMGDSGGLLGLFAMLLGMDVKNLMRGLGGAFRGLTQSSSSGNKGNGSDDLPFNPAKLHQTKKVKDAMDAIKKYSTNPQRDATIAGVETGFKYDSDSSNPNSSAKGLFQDIDGTWKQYFAQAQKKNPDIVNNPYDMKSSILVNNEMQADNEATLKAAHIDTNNTNMYIMHMLGKDGGLKYLLNLRANKGRSAHQDFKDAAAGNAWAFEGKDHQDLTYDESYKKFGKMVGRAGDVASQGLGDELQREVGDAEISYQAVRKPRLSQQDIMKQLNGGQNKHLISLKKSIDDLHSTVKSTQASNGASNKFAGNNVSFPGIDDLSMTISDGGMHWVNSSQKV